MDKNQSACTNNSTERAVGASPALGAAYGEQTFGEKAVGLTFNPSGDERVNGIKTQYAAVVDNLNYERQLTTDGEAKRLLSVAITEAQGAQMWAVKALTWKS